MTLPDSSPRFAFQGVPGAFSHSAGKLFARTLGQEGGADFHPCNTFAEMFEQVVSGQCEYGVVPLENSSIGSISANYDLLWTTDVKLIGEVSMPIHHHLIGLNGADPFKLSEIYSHPAALDQCRNLFRDLAGVRPVAHFDTSGAARFVREQNDARLAALAGEAAAHEHGLAVLRANVEDYPENTTRFGIISKHARCQDNPQELPNPPYKISCAVELPHQPGALAKLLTRLASLELNLTKIESRPIPQVTWHYRFFIDIELDGHDQDAGVVRVLKDSCEAYRLLGRYLPWHP